MTGGYRPDSTLLMAIPFLSPTHPIFLRPDHLPPFPKTHWGIAPPSGTPGWIRGQNPRHQGRDAVVTPRGEIPKEAALRVG